MANMNFLQKLVTRKLLKGLEKMAQKDPVIRKSFEELGDASYKLAQDIEKFNKERKDSGLWK